MQFISRQTFWIMFITGAVTTTMFQAFIDPQAALTLHFGVEEIKHPLSAVIIRNWGALIGLTGLALIYGAFKPELRSFIMLFASLSKIIFIYLVLTYGSQYMDTAINAIIFDIVCILLYIICIIWPSE